MIRSTRSKDVAVGAGIVLFIVYLVLGLGYALLYPEVRPEFDEWDDYRCAGPPYEIC